MFKNSENTLIAGGTFTEHHQHHHGSTSGGIDRLLKAACLGAMHNSGERFSPPKCHPNTRITVLKNLMSWALGELGWDRFLLWLYAPAGAGKSSIGQTFAEKCALADSDSLLASFFFSRSDPRRNTAQTLAATLAYQLWLRIPESRESIEAAIDNNPALFELNFETQFESLFLDPLHRLYIDGRFRSGKSFPNVVIIDGLDECRDPNVQCAILYAISDAPQRFNSSPPFKFLIASRPEYHLTTAFYDPPLSNLTSRLHLDDTYTPDKDIRLYLADSFRDIRKTHIMRSHLSASWPSGEDMDRLVAKSSGQFIYAATVMRYVSSPRHNPSNRLEVITSPIPISKDRPYTQLDALYIDILSEVEDIEAALQVLSMALLLYTNSNKSSGDGYLSVKDLEQFMQLSPGAIQLLLIDLLSVVDASNYLEPMKFYHASFGDFLFNSNRSLQFYLDPTKRHQEAADFCVSVINSTRSPAHLKKFACQSLERHLRKAGPLQDNTLLRENILDIPFSHRFSTRLQWWGAVSSTQNIGIDYFTKFLKFLQTSFLNTDELYLHHRGIFDRQLRQDLESFPNSTGLAFWIAVCAGGISSNNISITEVCLQTIVSLSPSSPASENFLCVPISLFTAHLPDVKTYDGRLPQWAKNLVLHFDDPYLLMVTEFLRDPVRAQRHAINEHMYTMGAEFVVEFAIRELDSMKAALVLFPGQFGFIWDAIEFMLSKAGYSANLINLLAHPCLTFVLGLPLCDVQRRLQSLFEAVSNYLLRFRGSLPSGFTLVVDWTWQWASGLPPSTRRLLVVHQNSHPSSSGSNTPIAISFSDHHS